jgi:anti-sigma B factor antagonist
VDISIEKNDDITMVTVQAESLDASNAAEFKRLIGTTVAPKAKVILDLARVQFIDSTGCGAILGFLRQLNPVGGDLKICSVSKGVRALFELVRMHRILDIFNTCDEAKKAFKL